MEEIILVDKPAGVTSFDVVKQVQKKYGAQKAGHAGTLDPMATGLIVIGLNTGTKKLNEYVGLSKTYEAEIILGVRTDTGDITGKILEEKEGFDISKKDVGATLEEMVGVIRLPVSAYSAMKQGGEPLYKKVRMGKPFIQPLRDMEVISAQCNGVEAVEGKIHVHVTFEVGSGTYIRSLAEELGKRLGCPATLGALRRTRVGDFTVADAIQL